MGIEQYFGPASKANICFDCQNACGGCRWAMSFEPVPGWTAKKVKQKITGKTAQWVDTYHITACPEFIADGERRSSYESVTDEEFVLIMKRWKRLGEL